MAGPLTHIKVLDLSRVLAGPWCGQLLADLGADVIKVERPDGGDDTRGWGPPYLRDADGGDTSEAAYYLSANRGKRSVCIDFTQPEGQALVRALARKSDVLLENFKVGGLAKYGLDYAALVASNPALIYCSITGFGQTGPYAARPGYDFMIQGLGGFMSLTGERDDRPGGGPQKAGVAIADLFTGMYATVAVLAALAGRAQTGRGQYIDLALLDVQVAVLANQALNFLTSGVNPRRYGNAHPNIVPYEVFACADGHIIIAVGNDAQFRRLCVVLGRPDWGSDPRFQANADRVAVRTQLSADISAIVATQSCAYWLQALEAAGIPCGPINTLAQVFEDPQVVARGLRIELDHPLAGHVPQVANPIRYSDTTIAHERPPPLLGQHTDEILAARAGVDAEHLSDLRARGIIA
jgi:crotonobetainyl-CoA:carnitine CoA-transferase CaiB-like acyl-CoA transferase